MPEGEWRERGNGENALVSGATPTPSSPTTTTSIPTPTPTTLPEAIPLATPPPYQLVEVGTEIQATLELPSDWYGNLYDTRESVWVDSNGLGHFVPNWIANQGDINWEESWVRGPEYTSGEVSIESKALAQGVSLTAYAWTVLDDLKSAHDGDNLHRAWNVRTVWDYRRRGWPEDAILFQVDKFEPVTVGGRDYYRLEYRFQSRPWFQLQRVAELITVAADVVPGSNVGFRVRAKMGQKYGPLAPDFGPILAPILESYRLTAGPPEYYTQYINADGVLIKANSDVNPRALKRAARAVEVMTQGRDDIALCMSESGAQVAVYPEGDNLTTLPDFRYLSGKISEKSGRPYEDVPGVWGRFDVAATSEEDLLQWETFGRWEIIAETTVHELAHAIEDLCFNSRDRERLTALYQSAYDSKVTWGYYADTNEKEFFAEFTSVYFNSTNDLSPVARDRDHLKRDFPELHEFLHELFGDAPENEFRVRQ